MKRIMTTNNFSQHVKSVKCRKMKKQFNFEERADNQKHRRLDADSVSKVDEILSRAQDFFVHLTMQVTSFVQLIDLI